MQELRIVYYPHFQHVWSHLHLIEAPHELSIHVNHCKSSTDIFLFSIYLRWPEATNQFQQINNECISKRCFHTHIHVYSFEYQWFVTYFTPHAVCNDYNRHIFNKVSFQLFNYLFRLSDKSALIHYLLITIVYNIKGEKSIQIIDFN